MFLFNKILGQKEVKQHLLKLSKSEKQPHSYLFNGKMGYSTFALALAYLKYLYCQNPTENDSCDECSSCGMLNNFQHPDIHFILPSFESKTLSADLMPKFRDFVSEKGEIFDIKDWMEYNKAKNAKIRTAEIPKILHQANMSSYLGGYTTIVIWNFESIGNEQNKLLKILEEPPLKTRFVLVSENINQILPTVISRCSIQKVNRYSDDEVKQYLTTKNIENISTEQLGICQGNLILANQYFDAESSEDNLDEMLFNYLKGMLKFNERKIENIKYVLAVNDQLASSSKNDCKKFFEYYLSFLRQVLIQKYSGTGAVSPSLEKPLDFFASNLEIDQIDLWVRYVENTLRYLEGNVNKKICFVSLAIKVGRLQNRTEFEKIELANI